MDVLLIKVTMTPCSQVMRVARDYLAGGVLAVVKQQVRPRGTLWFTPKRGVDGMTILAI